MILISVLNHSLNVLSQTSAAGVHKSCLTLLIMLLGVHTYLEIKYAYLVWNYFLVVGTMLEPSNKSEW